jgi:hypothetical protein
MTLEQAEIIAEPQVVTVKTAGRDPLIVRCVLWGVIAIYILAMACWAFHAGMQLRDDAWVNSRTIRFHGDISNGLHWGGLVLRQAEQEANAQTPPGGAYPRAARAAPTPGDPNERPLTFWELLHGEDALYKSFVDGEPTEGDYGLDYPPMRLMVMTQWAQHVANQVHAIPSRPGEWRLDYSATGDPSDLMTEDIARPMLKLNAYSIAFAAACAFFLVWVWVNRGGRPALPQPRTGWTAWFGAGRVSAGRLGIFLWGGDRGNADGTAAAVGGV